jgi:hypothetical protein
MTTLEASSERRTALVSQDPAATLHHRRRRKATCTKTTQRSDTICVKGVAERTPRLSRRHSACVPPAGVEGHHNAETHQRTRSQGAPAPHHRVPTRIRCESIATGKKKPPPPLTRLTSRRRQDRTMVAICRTMEHTSVDRAASSNTDGETDVAQHKATTPPSKGAHHHLGRHLRTMVPASPNGNPLRMMAEQRGGDPHNHHGEHTPVLSTATTPS